MHGHMVRCHGDNVHNIVRGERGWEGVGRGMMTAVGDLVGVCGAMQQMGKGGVDGGKGDDV